MEGTIEYKSIIMRCDRVNESAFLELDPGVELVNYQPGMETVWAKVQKNAGEFAGKSDVEVQTFFLGKYGREERELKERCIFLREKETGRYIATCMAWYGFRKKERISVLHWLAVDQAYAGKGYARKMITQVLRRFIRLGEAERIYLHTQPSSYRAVKLYHDFGFCMTREDTYGAAVNEYEGAMAVLQQCMTETAYRKLAETSVL